MTPPIIDRPERQGTARRTAYGTVTAGLWLLYFYLWLPLVTLLAWVVGVRTGYGRLYVEQNAVDPFLLMALPVIALVCGAVLLAWAEYNRARFSGEERRQPVADIGIAEVATLLGADVATAGMVRDARVVTITLDDKARPSAAALMAPGAPLAAPGAPALSVDGSGLQRV